MATLTNSICTTNQQIDIQAGTNSINIGTTSASNNIVTIGANTSTGSSVALHGGSFCALSLNSNGSANFSTNNNNLIIDAGSATLALRAAAGTIQIGLSGGSATVTMGNSSSTSTTTIQAGSGKVNVTSPTATVFSSSLATAPVASSTATTAYGTSLTAGTALQNTTGYNLLVNICVNVTAATSATIVLGVGSTNTPTTNTVVSTFTTAAVLVQNFTAIVPQNYYLLVNTTGTITVGSITTQVCPM